MPRFFRKKEQDSAPPLSVERVTSDGGTTELASPPTGPARAPAGTSLFPTGATTTTTTAPSALALERDASSYVTTTDNDTDAPTANDQSSYTEGLTRTIIRYRGFSTSIKSLFLDEPLVCASLGFCGLLLSNRTEHLLQLRNERRGVSSPRNSQEERKRLPSRLLAWVLLFSAIAMFATFLVFGFGTGNGVADAYANGYDYYGNRIDNKNGANNNNNNQYQQGDQQDDYVEWDDFLYNNADDGRYGNQNNNGNNKNNNNNNNNQQNNDNQYEAGDDGYQDGAAANDDANYNAGNNNNANYNGGNNNNANYKYGNNYNKYQNYNNKYQNYNNYNGNRRAASVTTSSTHALHGVFKLRDTQEYLWDPLYDLIRNEWMPEEDVQEQRRQQQNNNYNQYADQSSSSASGNDSMLEDVLEAHSLAGYVRLAILVFFMCFLGFIGRRRRMRTRFYLVRARAQEDHLYYAASEATHGGNLTIEDTREDQYEGACSHTLCGCYPIDDVTFEEVEDDVGVSDDGIFKRKKSPHHEDIVQRGFNCLMDICCGRLCTCWFQCLSICALAQEAREMRLLVPPRYQRIDFLTHQPFHEYQNYLNDLRRGWLGKGKRQIGVRPHWYALSRLSRYILLTFLIATVSIVATLIFNPYAAFSWYDAVVLAVTFGQSFAVIFIVHWIFHRSDLSMDAVIKLFAAGFLVAVPSALIIEGLLVNLSLVSAWSVYEVFASIGGDYFVDWVYAHWRSIWMIGELFNAYIVAAVTEELCKYYSFRAVEHPDLVFLTGLNRFKQDEKAIEGGVVKYPFAAHQVQELNRNNSFDSQRSNISRSAKTSGRKEPKDTLIHRTGTRDDEFDEDESDVRTHRQRAMAITTGMISVAVGLACAENFIYVFVLGGVVGSSHVDEEAHSDILQEWIVLFFRSVFPVHALAAAMQSINMIRKFVESDNDNGHRIGVGRIVLPAILLHGTFDAILMAINVYVETAWQYYIELTKGDIDPNNPPYNVIAVNTVAWISISVVMLVGLIWYYREHRNQRQRLLLLETAEKNRRKGTWAPKAQSKEIV